MQYCIKCSQLNYASRACRDDKQWTQQSRGLHLCHVDAMISSFECIHDVCSQHTCNLIIVSIDVSSALNWIMKSECRGGAWSGWWVSRTRMRRSIPTWWTSSMRRPWKVPSLETTMHRPPRHRQDVHEEGAGSGAGEIHHAHWTFLTDQLAFIILERRDCAASRGWMSRSSFFMSLAAFKFGAWET